jgi:hypothetical protein
LKLSVKIIFSELFTFQKNFLRSFMFHKHENFLKPGKFLIFFKNIWGKRSEQDPGAGARAGIFDKLELEPEPEPHKNGPAPKHCL